EQGADIPRLTKIILANNLLNKNSTDLFLGREIGAFKGGTTLRASSFAIEYNWLLLGSRPYIFFLLISGGWLLLLLMVCYFSYKLYGDNKTNQDIHFTFLLTILFITILFYNDAPRNQLFSYLFIYFILKAKGW